MPKFWQNRMLLGYSAVCAIGFYLVMMQLDSLKRLGDAQQAMARPAEAVTFRPLNMDRVFSFPETTCGPDPKPVFYGASVMRQVRHQTVNVAGLVRDQFRYGMLLSGCLLTGLLLGFALTYRAAQRETRFAYLKSSFVSNMSHEMKTPLATIQMFAETLESGRIQDPAKMAEYHRVIKKESLRLGQLIEDVLDFNRMESEMYTFRFAPVGIAGLLRPLAEDFRQQVEHQGGTFRVSISDNLPVLAIDAKSMAQAVQNLLSNALKYSPEMKWIVLSAEERSNQICISVSDRGIGIGPTEREKIFEKFYRAESDLVHNTKGAGLGLAMVRQIVKAHHGQVIVESEPGKGSRFTIQLPIQKHGAQAA